jgi:hypothetical protein
VAAGHYTLATQVYEVGGGFTPVVLVVARRPRCPYASRGFDIKASWEARVETPDGRHSHIRNTLTAGEGKTALLRWLAARNLEPGCPGHEEVPLG